MSRATLAGIRKGQRELVEAYKQAAAVFGEPMELSCSAHNGRTFSDYEAYAKDDVWAKHATSCWVRVAELCEYGRPREWGERTFVWQSDFVSVHLSAAFPYNIYWHEYGSTDPEGNQHTKAGLHGFKMSLTVSGGRRFGLGDWEKKRESVIAWAGKFADKKAGQALLDGVRLADSRITDWRERVAAMAKSAGVAP